MTIYEINRTAESKAQIRDEEEWTERQEEADFQRRERRLEWLEETEPDPYARRSEAPGARRGLLR
jgi:hypothetical protein